MNATIIIYIIMAAACVALCVIYYRLGKKIAGNKKYCPNCGKEWKRIDSETDVIYHCKKCGLTTYNSHKFEAEMKERSINY